MDNAAIVQVLKTSSSFTQTSPDVGTRFVLYFPFLEIFIKSAFTRIFAHEERSSVCSVYRFILTPCRGLANVASSVEFNDVRVIQSGPNVGFTQEKLSVTSKQTLDSDRGVEPFAMMNSSKGSRADSASDLNLIPRNEPLWNINSFLVTGEPHDTRSSSFDCP
ncbi:hypothetical protein PC129_g7296 [Phytophthora cactorum]|uniref:Uncharacterized protein n=1 Tax=Phytophthora cactorum TaxID=29920 RepID=A0A329RLI6_9STRA|nr:hypothetical protein Pcac1_g6578 [Phytophthora cactorum]KAG2828616.1 hypothetical protein PC112_g8392 [Phytophthora cactorum]KAG2847289.1 hypothetical protein PC111_g888 [Phytophthora cactorum]KAG2861377.1 hypothetical protein PC113_g7216 [Phytophthora cactorum]KAG2916868.1 hypothetical protein PC114_g7340 [Phytophthora cactorum]